MKKYPRKTITDTVIRIAQDTHFQMDHIRLITFAANTLDCHPFEVYTAIGSLDTAEQIARGTHPATKKET